jgi:hypothetical protein
MDKVKNHIANSLRSRKYHSKVVQSKKLYNRKKEKLNSLIAAAQKDYEQKV